MLIYILIGFAVILFASLLFTFIRKSRQKKHRITPYIEALHFLLENKKDELKEWCYVDDNGVLQGKFAKIFEQAIRLEDTKIIQSKHAAGVVVSPQPIYDVCPMVIDKEGKGQLAGFEGPSCEDAGLLKLDVLGIKMLDKIMEIPTIIKNTYRMTV